MSSRKAGPVRVVITGIGLITPIGNNRKDFWEAAIQGTSGVRRIEAFDVTTYRSQIGGEVRNFDADLFLSPEKVERTDRFTQYALAAAKMALEEARPPLDNPYRIGVSLGSGMGGVLMGEMQLTQLYLSRTPHAVHPTLIPKSMPNAAAGHLSIEFGIKGPNMTFSTACSSGAHAIGHAFDLIRWEKADAVVAGGVEACVLPLTMAGFCTLRALSTRYNEVPSKASRPFDKRRDGFVLAEGAGMIVLERLDQAKRRGAPIYAEVIGYGATSEASHMVIPEKTGKEAARTMRLALEDAQIRPEQVDYINAHATSTPIGDLAEANAIKEVFKGESSRIPIGATKSLIGHPIGAAGAIETIVCALTIQEGLIHPTINYEEPDPECGLDDVPNQPREKNVRIALSNSFGFGGNNSTLILKKID